MRFLGMGRTPSVRFWGTVFCLKREEWEVSFVYSPMTSSWSALCCSSCCSWWRRTHAKATNTETKIKNPTERFFLFSPFIYLCQRRELMLSVKRGGKPPSRQRHSFFSPLCLSLTPKSGDGHFPFLSLRGRVFALRYRSSWSHSRRSVTLNTGRWIQLRLWSSSSYNVVQFSVTRRPDRSHKWRPLICDFPRASASRNRPSYPNF